MQASYTVGVGSLRTSLRLTRVSLLKPYSFMDHRQKTTDLQPTDEWSLTLPWRSLRKEMLVLNIFLSSMHALPQ